jgi:hypothetical protein
MTNTDPSFIPRAAPFESDCATNPGCYQPYTVTISPSNLAGSVTFQLNSSALPGYATNACFSYTPGCTDSWDYAPDFWFEGYRQPAGFNAPANQDQTVRTSAPVTSATATVSSRDYGGNAKVSATVDFNGIRIQALVTGTGELFARLPIDICKAQVDAFGNVTSSGCRPNGDTNPDDYYSNGIADTWETQKAGRYLDRNEDYEGSWPGSSSRGDGYTAFEEYRGFMYWNGATIVHVRTNPTVTKDVFYFDEIGMAPSLQAMLAPQTAGPGGICAQNPNPAADPCMRFYQIADWAANFSVPADHTQSVNPHNFASLLAPGTINAKAAFAVVYVSSAVNNCAGQGSSILGVTPTGTNDGSKPVYIANGGIACVAARYLLDENLLRAEVVSHETGHRFGLNHPQRTINYIAMPDPLQSLGLGQFTVDFVNRWVWAWRQYYPWLDSNLGHNVTVFSDGILPGVGALNTNDTPEGQAIPLTPVGILPGTENQSPSLWSLSYAMDLNLNPQPGGVGAPLVLEFITGYIMDWTPDYHRLTPGQPFGIWDFDVAGKTGMCVKSVCP